MSSKFVMTLHVNLPENSFDAARLVAALGAIHDEVKAKMPELANGHHWSLTHESVKERAKKATPAGPRTKKEKIVVVA